MIPELGQLCLILALCLSICQMLFSLVGAQRGQQGLMAAGPAAAAGQFVFVAGGILEVQPNKVTVLADTAIRGHDLDEAKAVEARQLAEEAMKNAKTDIDFAAAQGEFASMAAQIAAIQKFRRK